MDWFSQNWVWLLAALGLGIYFFRGGMGGLAGGMGHSGHAAAGEASGGGADAPDAAVDPVGGDAVRTAQALTSLYQGKIYYFASKENRERFEAAPQDYAKNAVGHSPQSAGSPPPARRHGCC